MSEYVKWIQKSLTAVGYDLTPVDGVNGEKTDAAIRRFQSDRQLEVDGLVGENTHNALLMAMNMTLPTTEGTDLLKLKDFADDEFACRCGCGLDVVAYLKIFAQQQRDFFGWPLTISSGAQCPPVNQEDGGVPDSCHLTGEAFDCYFPGQMNEDIMAQMADFAEGHVFGVISYPNQLFCHFQIPPRNDFIY